MDLPVFGLCSLLLVQSLGTSGKSLTLLSLVLLTEDLHMLKSSSLLGLNSPSSLRLSSCDVLPSLVCIYGSLLHWLQHVFLISGSPEVDLSSRRGREQRSPLSISWWCFSNAAQDGFGLLCCWLMFSLVLTRNSQLLLCRASSQLVGPLELFSLCKTWHVLMLNVFRLTRETSI